MPNVRYEYWVHRPTREYYVVRLTNDRITGCFGPLDTQRVAGWAPLDTLDYREADWIERQREEFIPAVEWLEKHE